MIGVIPIGRFFPKIINPKILSQPPRESPRASAAASAPVAGAAAGPPTRSRRRLQMARFWGFCRILWDFTGFKWDF